VNDPSERNGNGSGKQEQLRQQKEYAGLVAAYLGQLRDPESNKNLLHYAVASGNAKMVQIVLELCAPV